MNKRKYILTLIAILVIVMLLVAGGTYAYWSWNSDVTKNVVFNTSKGISEYIVYDEGDSFFIGDFQPKSSFCQSTSTTLSFYKKSEVANIGLTATINMDVNHIDSAVASSSAVHWILTKGDNTVTCDNGLSSTDVVASGTFNGVTSGNTITLKSNIEITTAEQKFTVWIWIDNAGSNLSDLSGKTIDTNIWTQIDMLDVSDTNTQSCIIEFIDAENSENWTEDYGSEYSSENTVFVDLPSPGDGYWSVYDENQMCSYSEHSPLDTVLLDCGTKLYFSKEGLTPC